MTQRQQWCSSGGEQAWLALLIEAFETVSRDPTTAVDPAGLIALKSQLARPAAAILAGSFARH